MTQPLEETSVVKLKRPFVGRGGTRYRPSRFGVVIPAGETLPSDAVVLKTVPFEETVAQPAVADSTEEDERRAEAKAAGEATAKKMKEKAASADPDLFDEKK